MCQDLIILIKEIILNLQVIFCQSEVFLNRRTVVIERMDEEEANGGLGERSVFGNVWKVTIISEDPNKSIFEVDEDEDGDSERIESNSDSRSNIEVEDSNEDVVFCCSYCGEESDSKSKLEEHIDSVHFPPERVEDLENGGRYDVGTQALLEDDDLSDEVYFCCCYCGEESVSKIKLEEHIFSVHLLTEEERLNGIPEDDGVHGGSVDRPGHSNATSFHCYHCGERRSTKDELQEHILGVHFSADQDGDGVNEGEQENGNSVSKEGSVLSKGWKVTIVSEDANKSIFEAETDFENEDGVVFIEGSQGEAEVKKKKQRKYRFGCDYCGEMKMSKVVLRNHIFITHLKIKLERKKKKLKKYECRKCHKICMGLSRLKTHYRFHTGEKPFQCQYCDNRYYTTSHLTMHKRSHTGKKPFLCDKCPYSSVNITHLKDHLRTHSGEKPFKCKRCKFRTTQRSALKIHMRKHLGDKPFQCNLCSYRAARSPHLKEHLLTHTGEKRFKCNVCDFTATAASALKIHRRTHSGEKPFKCDQCDYRATRSSHLTIHMRRHTGEKPYKCPLCDFSAGQSPALKTHLNKVHLNDNFRCNLCDQSFRDLKSFERHKLTHIAKK